MGAGASVDITGSFTAPGSPGTYRATYQMQGPAGVFGQQFWVEIQVGASCSPCVLGLGFDYPVGALDPQNRRSGDGWAVEQGFNSHDYDSRYFHAAVDLQKVSSAGSLDGAGTVGQPVFAVADGIVQYAACPPDMDYPGCVVILEHRLSDGTTIYTMYAHVTSLSAAARAVGGRVSRGAQLAVVLSWPGSEGVGNSHLYFEVRTFLTRDDVNGDHPVYAFRCSYRCVPGPGYWIEDARTVGWLEPMAFISAHRSG